MIGILILATVVFITVVAAAYDVAHDGYGRIRTDWSRVPDRPRKARRL